MSEQKLNKIIDQLRTIVVVLCLAYGILLLIAGGLLGWVISVVCK